MPNVLTFSVIKCDRVSINVSAAVLSCLKSNERCMQGLMLDYMQAFAFLQGIFCLPSLLTLCLLLANKKRLGVNHRKNCFLAAIKKHRATETNPLQVMLLNCSFNCFSFLPVKILHPTNLHSYQKEFEVTS